jgi:hypothetical protein
MFLCLNKICMHACKYNSNFFVWVNFRWMLFILHVLCSSVKKHFLHQPQLLTHSRQTAQFKSFLQTHQTFVLLVKKSSAYQELLFLITSPYFTSVRDNLFDVDFNKHSKLISHEMLKVFSSRFDRHSRVTESWVGKLCGKNQGKLSFEEKAILSSFYTRAFDKRA